jgi:hypothetical protein
VQLTIFTELDVIEKSGSDHDDTNTR